MCSQEALQELSLPALFQRGTAIVEQLEAPLSSNSPASQLIQQGEACWRQAARAADSLSLFSSNEELEDLATTDIKYLLIPFYLAEILAQTHAAGDPRPRLAALEQAVEQYRAYLQRCCQYGLLSPPALALAEGVLRQADDEGGSSAPAIDAATLRQRKVDKFKREKHIKGRLEALEQQRRLAQHAEADDGALPGSRDGGGEEYEREAWLLQADLAALQAADRVGTLQQEILILRHAASLPEEQRQQKRQQQQQQGQAPSDLLRQLHAAAASLADGTSQRQRLASDVFKPSYTLPTMSVEQFGELEYRRMLEQQRREAEAKEQRQRAQAERRADEVEEEELQQQRAWDEFRDDNPRGWGNSKLRPCA